MVHDTYPRETNVGIYVMNRVLGTYPDFVILCLVLQILIKFLLGVEFNAIHFKLLSNLEAGGEAWWPSVRIEGKRKEGRNGWNVWGERKRKVRRGVRERGKKGFAY